MTEQPRSQEAAPDPEYHEHVAGDKHSHPFGGPHSHGGVSALYPPAQPRSQEAALRERLAALEEELQRERQAGRVIAESLNAMAEQPRSQEAAHCPCEDHLQAALTDGCPCGVPDHVHYERTEQR